MPYHRHAVDCPSNSTPPKRLTRVALAAIPLVIGSGCKLNVGGLASTTDGSQSEDAPGDLDGRVRSCGDGIVDSAANEQCDDGNDIDNDHCTNDCNNAVCGDGFVFDIGGTEQCDDTGESAVCDLDCTFAICGDANVNATAGESCDDGNDVDGDDCTTACDDAVCGDGFVFDIGGTEQCDDTGESAVCDLDCTFAICGDATINASANEKCDDEDTNSGDGCDSSCEIEDGWSCSGEPSICADGCGNGVLDLEAGEVCDDGNLIGGDGCTTTCRIQNGWACIQEPSVCTQSCGDGIVDAAVGEECDDDGANSNDGCGSSCRVEVGWSCSGEPSTCVQSCGNGMVESDNGEECDDGNTVPNDGCKSCQVQNGWSCTGEPSVCTNT